MPEYSTEQLIHAAYRAALTRDVFWGCVALVGFTLCVLLVTAYLWWPGRGR